MVDPVSSKRLVMCMTMVTAMVAAAGAGAAVVIPATVASVAADYNRSADLHNRSTEWHVQMVHIRSLHSIHIVSMGLVDSAAAQPDIRACGH